MEKKTKEKVLKQIKEEKLANFAQQILRIPSFKTEETHLARFLANYFRRKGYQVELQEVEPGRFQTIATLKGSGGGKSLMLNGHIDIDPLAMGWRRDPFNPTWEGDRIYGAGANNMKGGLTSLIGAAEALRKAKVSLKGDLIIACVVGELQGGVGTIHALKQGLRTDMAIVAEPYGKDNVLTVHVGWIQIAIHTLGLSQHASRLEKSIDAIEKMIKVIPAIKKTRFTYTPRPDLPDMPRLMVGCIIGGRGRDHDLKGPNFTSDFCTILADVRTVPGQTPATVEADIRRTLDALKAEDPELKYEIEQPPSPHYKTQVVTMNPLDVPKDEYIVQSVVRNYQELTGHPPATVGTLVPRSYAGNDTCHLWEAGIPCVLYGPDGGRDEKGEPDGFVYLSHVAHCAKVIALTALEVCSIPK